MYDALEPTDVARSEDVEDPEGRGGAPVCRTDQGVFIGGMDGHCP
jgi:hypothetical protein